MGQATVPLKNEEAVRAHLKSGTFSSQKGGHQVRRVYVGTELTVYELKRRDQIFWDEETKQKIEKNPLFNPFYQFFRKLNFFPVFQLKQGIKFLIAVLNGDPSAGPLAMEATLQSYRRAEKISRLTDPFTILDRVELRTGPYSKVSIAPAIVRYRCEKLLSDELEGLISKGKRDEAKALIDSALDLDQRMWEEKIFNIDFSFKNYRLFEGRVVLRDCGHILDNYEEAVRFLENLNGLHGKIVDEYFPIPKNIKKLKPFSEEISFYYREKALRTYNIQNFNSRWFKNGR